MGKDSKQHKKKKISHKPVKKERNNNHSKDKDLSGHGIRVGYHSEAAKMPEYKEGEEMGYHSEAAKMPEYKEGEGMKIGYHSEAANISSHSDRLHDNKDSLTEQKVGDDDNDASDQ
ncbi:MAG: hypothetical protein M3114_07190 [Thermoproteota archaeon]|nr:hypothetical protein [Thermoproteota archaeon]MDQ4067354.1 hypothetical protein [Thermoproteota archaeon]